MINLDFNPGLKKEIEVATFNEGQRNLIKGIKLTPIGTAYELEYLLNLANESSTLFGFLGKHPTNMYRNLLPNHTNESFISVKDKIYEEITISTSKDTVLYNEVKLTKEEITDFLNLYDTLLTKHNLVVGFDELKDSLPKDFYKNLLKITKLKGKEFYLEIKTEATLRSLNFMPDFSIISDEALEFLKVMYPTTLGIVEYLKSLGIDRFIINKKSDGYIINLKDHMEVVEVEKLERYDNLGLMAGVLISKLKNFNLKETLDIVMGFYLAYNKYKLNEIDIYKIKEEYGRKYGKEN